MIPMTERTASCSCGRLTVTTLEEPLRVSVCHCLACQRRTGSVFGAQARFHRAAVEIRGESTAYVRIGDEGTVVTFSFCPVCGSTVHYQFGEDATFVAVPIGAFADPGFPAPSLSIYGHRMHPWVTLSDVVQHVP